jgi:hypothetical protein
MATKLERERAAKRRRSQHNYHLKTTYGITIDEYELILEAQGGVCAICGGGTSKKHFAVDHNHKTGQVRGLLCARCNSGLAKFMDKLENLLKAYAYMLDDGRTVEVLLVAARADS